MRTYEEMKKNVFNRIEEYNTKKKKKIIYSVSTVSFLLISVLSSAYIFKLNFFEPNKDTNITGGYSSSNIALIIDNKSYMLSNKDCTLFTINKLIGFSDDYTTVNNELIEKESKIFTVREDENYIMIVSKEGKKTLLCKIGYIK